MSHKNIFGAKLILLPKPIQGFENTADLVTFTEEILNGKLHFLCSETYFSC